jgi:hypothetical protein
MSLEIALWPDGDWAVIDELFEYEYSHKSDDYVVVDLYDPKNIAADKLHEIINEVL